MATLAEMSDEVCSHQFSKGQYTIFSKRHLNRAQFYICAQTDFRVMERLDDIVTSAGVEGYDLPDDYQRSFSLIYRPAGGQPTKLNRNEKEDFDLLPVGSGVPTDYSIQGNQVLLNPVPDGVYTVRLSYYKEPAVMADSDEQEIPEGYVDLMIHRTLKKCYERENDATQAQYHDAEFERLIMKARGEVQHDTNDRDQPITIRGY